jgi:hypothetical protein
MRVGWLVMGTLLAFSSPVAAEDAPAGAHVVDLTLAASDSEAAAMERVARELLERLDVTVRVTRVPKIEPRVVVTPEPGAPPAVARIWVDLSGDGAPTLYVVDAPWERVLVRHLPPASDEVTREAAAHILETAVDALLRGARLGVEREKVELPALAPVEPAGRASTSPQPVPGPPSIPAPRSPVRPNLLRGELALSYEIQLFGPGPVVRQGPELSVGLTLGHGRVRPGALVAVQYRIPAIVDDIPVGLRFDSFATRALGVLDVSLTRRITLRAGLGAAFDFDRVSPRAGADPAVMIGAPASYLVPVLRITGGADIVLLEHLALDFGAALDLDFSGTQYVATDRGSPVVDFTPWPARPALYLGLVAR